MDQFFPNEFKNVKGDFDNILFIIDLIIMT